MDPQRSSTTPGTATEKRVWEIAAGLTPESADRQFGKSITESDLAVITKASSKLEMVLPDGPFLLFVGVGVGNPRSAWGNPSNSPSLDMAEQCQPHFLADARSHGLATVSITFNVRDGADFELHGTATQAYLDIGVRCPLVLDSETDRQALEVLARLAARAAGLTVMNSVSQIRYPALVELVNRRIRRAPAGRLESSYLSSYGETGAQYAIAPLQGRRAARRSSRLLALDDVLPPLADLDL